jgi:hypothetical protein
MDDRELAARGADILGTALAVLFEQGLDMAAGAAAAEQNAQPAHSAERGAADALMALAADALALATARAVLMRRFSATG